MVPIKKSTFNLNVVFIMQKLKNEYKDDFLCKCRLLETKLYAFLRWKLLKTGHVNVSNSCLH